MPYHEERHESVGARKFRPGNAVSSREPVDSGDEAQVCEQAAAEEDQTHCNDECCWTVAELTPTHIRTWTPCIKGMLPELAAHSERLG